MKKIKTFWRMPIQEKRMFFFCFVLCGVAKLAIYSMSYKRLAPYFGRSCKMLVSSTLVSTDQLQKALLIKRTVALAARYTPWNSSCLTQALVAKFWCKFYDIPYLLFIGVPREKKLASNADAHAWVTVGPVAVTGGYAFMTHHVICSYSTDRLPPMP